MGRLVHADVPYAPSTPRALEPLFVLSNASLFALHAPSMWSARVGFAEPLAPLLEAARARPLVWLSWHRYNFAATAALRALPPEIRPTLVMHDGVASRALTHEASAWLGFETFVFRRRSEVAPRAQLVDYVRQSGRSIVNLPDSGGPYGVMKPGILEVARACDALIVPFVVDARPALSLGRTLRHVVPLPFARVTLRRTAPLAGATVDDCQRALDALTESSRRAPAPG
jgi:lysophospholipid acyltransferase (LPLAT)-like uncharacterized protein